MTLSPWRRNRKNEHHSTDPKGPDMADPIPISHLCLPGENLWANTDEVLAAAKAAGYPVIEDWLTRPALDRHHAKALVIALKQDRADRAAANQETYLEATRRGDPTQQRLAAIAAHQQALRAGGQLDGVSAYAVMTADHFDERMARSSERLDDYLNSDATSYHRTTPKPGG
jgi:hypothetical protein